MSKFVPGQRWGSDAEPELGLGVVLKSDNFLVNIMFPAVDVSRTYAVESAPLCRVIFKVNDKIDVVGGDSLTVLAVEERDGVCHYTVEGGEEIPEILLSATTQFAGPLERLRALQLDSAEFFSLRLDALEKGREARSSEVNGFVGGRMDIIPHQLFIANEAVNRLRPRLMLADEVGLGKTIEACLIIHRLLLTNRISRVLILVPDSLIHQWFVEMLRRFNLQFHIVEPSHYSEYDGSLENNPFKDHQMVIAGIDFICKTGWKRELVAADWDMLVVDEAHHLEWSTEKAGLDYQIVEKIAHDTSGLLLLTATPEQTGLESQFARLRLLDPNKYFDYDEFLKENEGFQKVAVDAAELLDQPESEARDHQLKELLESHGPGRVLFRNTRKVVKGFPKRSLFLTGLEGDGKSPALMKEFVADCKRGDEPNYNLTDDARIKWLATFLKETGEDKILLICRSLKKARAIEQAVQKLINVKSSLFHEKLSIIQRDRNAAYFANPEGARLLICSEIGSEGRNFQFAEHLVFFDLPFDHELLEQRIGRLDRIGRKTTVKVHFPYCYGSPQEKLAKWFHYGLDCFEKNHEYGKRLTEFFEELYDLIISDASSEKMDEFVEKSSAYCKVLIAELENGRDRLLEMTSFNLEKATALADAMRASDVNSSISDFVYQVFDAVGISYDILHDRTVILRPGIDFSVDIPGFNPEGMVVTFDRECALSREDAQFLSWEHPMIRGILDMLASGNLGNSSFGFQEVAGEREILLEAVYLLEVIAPLGVHADRFLPSYPIRVAVNHALQNCSDKYSHEDLCEDLEVGNPQRILGNEKIRDGVLPQMVTKAEAAANALAKPIVVDALAKLKTVSDEEVGRLNYLSSVNPQVSDADVKELADYFENVEEYVESARLRLDSVRMIYRGDALN